MHSAGIEHQFKIFIQALQLVYQLQRILQVHIVVAGAVGQAQHIGLVAAVLLQPVKHAGLAVTLCIVLRAVHIALCVVAVIQLPVHNTAAGHCILEILVPFCGCQQRHCAAVGIALDAHLLGIDIRQGVKILDAVYEVLQLVDTETAVHCVHALLAQMAGRAGLQGHLHHAVVGPPLSVKIGTGIAVIDLLAVRTAVDVDLHGIFGLAAAVHIKRPYHTGRHLAAVAQRDPHNLALCNAVVVIFGALGIPEHLHVLFLDIAAGRHLDFHLPVRSVAVGGEGGHGAAVVRDPHHSEVVVAIGDALHLAVGEGHAVDVGPEAALAAAGGEEQILVGKLQKLYAPVILAVAGIAEILAVIRQVVNALPHLVVTHHIDALGIGEHILGPVHPGVLMLAVNHGLLTV